MDVVFNRIVPIFRMFDVDKAREFYLGFLGMNVEWEHRFADDAPLYMQVSRGAFKLHLSEHFGDGTPGSGLFVYMAGLTEFHRELTAKQYRHMRPGLERQIPGMQHMQVTDPFGNRITFGEPLPDDELGRRPPMPELPEVETVRRGLAPVMEGARFVKVEARRGDLRWPLPVDFVQRLQGVRVDGLSRRAKYLLADLSSGDILLMHLGMSGSFRVLRDGDDRLQGEFHHARSGSATHDHIVFHMSNGATVTFNDPRRFGSMKLVRAEERETEPLLRALGPEPLGNAFDAAMLAKACAGKITSLKAALSDQRIVAGLGNIYVCEALHRALLSPKRLAKTLAQKSGAPHARALVLVDAIKAVLADAIRAGGSSLRDHRATDGELGLFQHDFRVYDREGKPCVTPGCGGTVQRIVQTGRSTFYCARCQK